MNWVDYTVLGVLAASGLLAFLRGCVREVLGLGAWGGAAVAGLWALPYTRPRAKEWIPMPELVDPAAFAVAFLVALIVLLIVAHWIGVLVRRSVLGGLDRTLGLVFGLARGAALVVFAYVGAGMLVPIERWPEPVLLARSLPLVFRGADWLVPLVPPAYRPHVYPPPEGKPTTAAALLHANPQGSATGRAVGALPLGKAQSQE